MHWIYPPTHLEARQSHWRTYVVFGHTLWGSMRIVSSGARGALTSTKVDHRIQKWCDRVFGVSRTALAATGLEYHDGSPCILLSNHTSLLDIPAVCATWPRGAHRGLSLIHI